MWSSSATDSEQPSPNLIPSLPDDVALNCLARVPRSQHLSLSLVSKPFRSLLSSSVFFNVRSLLQCREHVLYLALRPHGPDGHLLWFSLHRNTLSSSRPNLLVPITPMPTSYAGSAYAVIGYNIYVIGGSIDNIPSPHVWILDCRFNTWQPGPSMSVGREFAAAAVVDGKIYVMGGCVADTWARSTNWAEVLDPAKGKWDPVPSPVDFRWKWMHACAVVDGKVHAMADRGGVVYDTRNEVWESVGIELDLGWKGRASVVNDVLYCYDYLGNIKGFYMKKGFWKDVRGLKKDLPKFLCGATMCDVGGKLHVLWEEKIGKEIHIWCAGIEVTKNEEDELWGKIAWSDKVLTVNKGSSMVYCTGVPL
ncbi:F-box/kelch-repeat protein SKIP6-like [Prosopis cineraria]|uniref:F-box/kelch-repeat protein SKIP6-like n=1 Tax=Prosopis cineraria TaxID=364024 RepID=UPI00240F195A|nr:F-box/kelch-repeat protein SKIP6-like [Prosopis cineraria]XP_054790416.1 F-box/kelch-repeat protein SKIP6-like [Prosopis cineraria]